jgi:hypothetical protein
METWGSGEMGFTDSQRKPTTEPSRAIKRVYWAANEYGKDGMSKHQESFCHSRSSEVAKMKKKTNFKGMQPMFGRTATHV